LGVGLISLLLILNKQVQEKFDKNQAGINLVIGAKGSPMQLILSSMYHIDNPTGNISIQEIKPFLNPKHPLIKTAIPVSLGDSYRGYRIVGTTPALLDLYKGEYAQGEIWNAPFEVVVGAGIAADLNMKLGDKFQSSHGFVQDDNLIHDDAQAFKVVGILQPTGSVIDQLAMTATQSIWQVHDSHDHGEEGHSEEEHNHNEEAEDHDDHDHSDHDHAEHDHEGHDHSEHDDHDHAEHTNVSPKAAFSNDLTAYPDKQVTALLIQFKGRNFQALNMQRSINENTDMQAATPAIEINRLYSMMGVGIEALQWLAMAIILVSALSIFISLYSSLKDRKYELALMRVMGASPAKIFFLIILEGLILAVIGYVIGIALSHIGMELLAGFMKDSYRYSFSGKVFLVEEWYLLAGSLLIGLVAAIIPAIQASRTDISETLSGS
ncbi:MAG: ABC transporter permease, partial [Saprospiraceae bacterium]